MNNENDKQALHQEWVYGVVRVKLWYVKRVLGMGVPFPMAWETHTDVFRHTDLFNRQNKHDPANTTRRSSPLWLALTAEAKKILDASAGFQLSARDEDVLFALVKERIDAGLEIDCRHITEEKSCYSARVVNDNDLALHFNNALSPDSPFDHPDILRNELQEILTRELKNNPSLKKVYMQSWLVQYPKHNELFPPAWSESVVLLGPDAGTGCWGQFTNRFGGFNDKLGAYLRTNGYFKYPYSRAECSLAELLSHLEQWRPMKQK